MLYACHIDENSVILTLFSSPLFDLDGAFSARPRCPAPCRNCKKIQSMLINYKLVIQNYTKCHIYLTFPRSPPFVGGRNPRTLFSTYKPRRGARPHPGGCSGRMRCARFAQNFLLLRPWFDQSVVVGSSTSVLRPSSSLISGGFLRC